MTQQQPAQQQYEQGGLPAPKQSGSLAAVQQYFGQPDVRKRVTFRLNNDSDRADRALANLYEVIETAKNPSQLLKCDPRSIITTCVQAEQLGLSIDARQLAYPVPRYNKDKGVTECNMQIGWRGYVKRLKETLRGCEVIVELVYEGDEFEIIGEGVRQSYLHKPADPFADGNMADENCKGGYCYVEWIGDDGERKSICGRMSIVDIEKARRVATTDVIWKQWWGEQAKKTVIKRTCKVQFSTITADLDAHDNEDYDLGKPTGGNGRASAADVDKRMQDEDKKESEENADTVSGDDAEITDIDPETGEVVGADADDESRSADAPTEPEPEEQSPPSEPEAETAEVASEAAEAPTTEAEKPEPVKVAIDFPLPEDAVLWDGRTVVVQGKTIQKDFNGIMAAVRYVESVIGKRSSREVRKQILQENIALTNSLIAGKHIKEFEALHKLITEGEEDGS